MSGAHGRLRRDRCLLPRARAAACRIPEDQACNEYSAAHMAGSSLGKERAHAVDPCPYRDYLQHFRAECARVGIHAFHGHRHFYAQERYKELTAWECPARGGPTSKQLTPKQKALDREAREVVSREMGHGREAITAVYLGR